MTKKINHKNQLKKNYGDEYENENWIIWKNAVNLKKWNKILIITHIN